MIRVIFKSNTMRQEVTKEITDTPKSVFEELGVMTENIVANIDGMVLSATDLYSPFSALNIQPGDEIRLNSVVKLDGGRIA